MTHIKGYLPQACPHGDSMILDCEVLMVDVKTGDPLPFGTLGIHNLPLRRILLIAYHCFIIHFGEECF